MSKPVIVALLAVAALIGCTSAAIGPAGHPAGHPAGASGSAASPHVQTAALAAPPSGWGSRPPRGVTPGAERHSRAALCPHVIASVAASRPARAVIARVYAEYGIANGQRFRYRMDRLVPLDLGGTNSIRNLWPQPAVAFHAKNRLGDRLHALVCSGRITLAAAQRAIRRNWRLAYRRYLPARPARSAAPSASSSPPAPSGPVPSAPVPSPPPALSSPPAAPAGCHPMTSTGHCYEPGEFCSDADHGLTGVAGDGKAIECEDNDGWRWEPI